MDLQKETNYVGGLPFGLALFCFFMKTPSSFPEGGEKPFDEKNHNRNSETQKLK